MERRPDGRVWAVPCECGQLRYRVARFDEAKLPAFFHGKTVERWDTKTRDEQAVKQWALAFQEKGKAGDRGILLVGGPGVGKTHLLCAILRFLTLERGIMCRFADSFQVLQDLKVAFDEGGNSAVLLEEICTVPVLVLDEVGKTRTDGWQHDVLDTIVSRRYDAGLTTLAATNYPLPKAGTPLDKPMSLAESTLRETLDRRVGARVYSRLMERCRTFTLTGEDRRLGG